MPSEILSNVDNNNKIRSEKKKEKYMRRKAFHAYYMRQKGAHIHTET